MTRRRLLRVLGIAVAVLALANIVWWLIPPRPGVTAANCARIRVGMRRDQVEAILGGPPGQYFGGRYKPPEGPPKPVDGYASLDWYSEEGWASVEFDVEEDAVCSAKFYSYREPSPLVKLLRYFLRLAGLYEDPPRAAVSSRPAAIIVSARRISL